MNRAIILSGIVAVGVVMSISILTLINSDNEDTMILVGTPADNYPLIDREKFCGTSEVKSNDYISEYEIPTECTQPQATTIDTQGNVWVAQSNTGNLAKFNPSTNIFTEYENTLWPTGSNSMIWGLDYSSDGFLWFTDDKHDSVWKFEISTQKYSRLHLPILKDSFPQKLQYDNSKLIINDFTGGRLIILDDIHSTTDLTPYSLPSNAPDSVIGAFTIDSKNNLWYTNWALERGGILAKFNKTSFDKSIKENIEELAYDIVRLPNDIKTPNGISEDLDGNIWLADSSSSVIFKYDVLNKTFSRYPLSPAFETSYGNQTGQVNSTASQPYWIKNLSGKLAFNEQGANRIGVLDPSNNSLVEYSIPSQNPHWGDCEILKDCGLAKIYDISILGEKIWFSEWAENKIGVVDTAIPLPLEIEIDSDTITLPRGESTIMNITTHSKSQNKLDVSTLITNPYSHRHLLVENNSGKENYELNPNNMNINSFKISTSENAILGEYRILLLSKTDNVSTGKFLTINVQ